MPAHFLAIFLVVYARAVHDVQVYTKISKAWFIRYQNISFFVYSKDLHGAFKNTFPWTSDNWKWLNCYSCQWQQQKTTRCVRQLFTSTTQHVEGSFHLLDYIFGAGSHIPFKGLTPFSSHWAKVTDKSGSWVRILWCFSRNRCSSEVSLKYSNSTKVVDKKFCDRNRISRTQNFFAFIIS
jgi:hypothetical protein